MLEKPVAGRDFPADLAELRAWFGTDADCLDYLEWLRWPQGFVCPHCKAEASWRGRDGRHRCKGCRRRVSVTAGTIFDHTKTPMTVWFEAVWAVTTDKSGTTAAHLHRVLPIGSYQTAWAMLGRLRALMSQAEGRPLGGPGVVVEIDETFIGGPRPGKRGRGAEGKVMVIGAVELARKRGFGRMRMAVIENATSASLRAFISANIAEGSTLRTDALNSYPGATEGYDHTPVNVKASGLPAHELLPGVHRIFSQAKRWLDGVYQGGVQAEHLQEYLDEYVFRFNRRTSRRRGMLFLRLLERAVTADPVTYADLVRIRRTTAISPTPPDERSTPGTLDVSPADRPWRR